MRIIHMKSSLSTVILLSSLFLLSSKASFAENTPLSVSVAKLSNLLVNKKSSAPAYVVSLNHTTISSEVTGQALKIMVETGDFVKKGGKLASIDCRSYLLVKKQAEAGLKVAKTQLNYSEKQYARNRRLIKTGIIAKEAFEKAEAGKLTALADIQLKKASIETAKLAIRRCQILSPFEGQITKRFVQLGELVTTGTPLFKILQSNRNEIKVNVSPLDVENLDDAPLLEFVTADKHYKAIVRSVIQSIDEATRTQEVRLALPKEAIVNAGLSGRLEWSEKEQLLPAEYLIRRNSILGVMIAEDIVEGVGHATFHQIIGAKEGLPALVSLADDTLIITKNRYQVKNGQDIKVR